MTKKTNKKRENKEKDQERAKQGKRKRRYKVNRKFYKTHGNRYQSLMVVLNCIIEDICMSNDKQH
jgi:hypothetical protein